MSEGEPLAGGNVGGAWKVGETVRRTPGPWTPAVHALLAHVTELRGVPRVHGFDELGREVLDFLPGHIVDVDTEELTDAQLVEVVQWTRALHERTSGLHIPGPWRGAVVEHPTVIGHNDIAPYNICFEGDRLVGVFDWDMAGPTTPVLELGFIAWNCVPLYRPFPAPWVAARLDLIARTYDGPTGAQILQGCLDRVEMMLAMIERGIAENDPGMVALHENTGEPEPSRHALRELRERVPALRAALRGPTDGAL